MHCLSRCSPPPKFAQIDALQHEIAGLDKEIKNLEALVKPELQVRVINYIICGCFLIDNRKVLPLLNFLV